jgi:hypothetical protein
VERRARALIVYESMFGNTEAVARAIAEGLAETIDTELADVGSAPTGIAGVDLLVVGAPTHALSLSRPQTRSDAGTKGARLHAATGDGVREWLATVDPAAPAVAAAFDTRIRRVPGSAARAIRRRLRRRGLSVPFRPMSFYVTGTPGPLADGELARARDWGRHLSHADTLQHKETTR